MFFFVFSNYDKGKEGVDALFYRNFTRSSSIHASMLMHAFFLRLIKVSKKNVLIFAFAKVLKRLQIQTRVCYFITFSIALISCILLYLIDKLIALNILFILHFSRVEGTKNIIDDKLAASKQFPSQVFLEIKIPHFFLTMMQSQKCFTLKIFSNSSVSTP